MKSAISIQKPGTAFLVTQIIRGSYVDGPGMRTVIFLKGCTLRCPWCHNPETQSAEHELLYDSHRCIRCQTCMKICPAHAINMELEYIIRQDRCTRCFACVKSCPADALRCAAQEMSVDQIMDEILKDRIFYETSGGGVTFSGGEPLLYFKTILEVLVRCNTNGINTALDTSLAEAWEHIDSIKEYIDLFLVDIKHSQNNDVLSDLVFANLEKIAKTSRIWIRIPVITNWNDTPELMQGIANRLKPYRQSIEQVSLLPFNRAAAQKYRYLNRGWDKFEHTRLIPDDMMKMFRDIFIRNNFITKIGA